MKRSIRHIAVLTTLGASLGLAASLAVAQQANWHPSKWGPKDEIGAANYLTPERGAAGAEIGGENTPKNASKTPQKRTF
jgi:hypothetical protein